MNNLYYVLIAGVAAMLFSFWKTKWINNQDEGNDRMKKIGKSIADGAMAFLKAEYRILSIFVLVVAILLALAARYQGDSMLISFKCTGLPKYESFTLSCPAFSSTKKAPTCTKKSRIPTALAFSSDGL